MGTQQTGFYQATCRPAVFDEERFSIAELRNAIDEATIEYFGAGEAFLDAGPDGEPYRIEDGFEARVSYPSGRQRFWQLRASGLLFHRYRMEEDLNPDWLPPGKYVLIDQVVQYVALAVDCAGRLYQALGVTGEAVTLSIVLLGTEHRQLKSRPERNFFGQYICPDPQVSIPRTLPVEEWSAGRVDLAIEISRGILQRFEWPDPYNPRSDIEELFARYHLPLIGARSGRR